MTDPNRIFVGGLRGPCSEEMLRQHFEAYGAVKDVYIPMDPTAGRPKGVAFVTFETPEAAQDAIANSPREIGGHPIGDIIPAVSRGGAAAPQQPTAYAEDATAPSRDDREATPERPSTQPYVSSPHGGGAGGGGTVRFVNRPASSQIPAGFDTNRVFIGGLRHDYTEEELRTHFEAYGAVLEVKIPFDSNTGRRKGMAYVTFETAEGSQNAVANSPRVILGHEIGDVVPAESRPLGAGASYTGSGPRGGGGGGGRGGGRGGGGSRGRGGGGGDHYAHPQSHPSYGAPSHSSRYAPPHQAAYSRAPSSYHQQQQQPEPAQQQQPGVDINRIFVGGLRHDYTEDELWQHFSAYGTVEQVFIPVDPSTGRKKGMAYITFTSPQGSLNAIARSPRMIGGYPIGDIVPAESRHSGSHSSSSGVYGGGSTYGASPPYPAPQMPGYDSNRVFVGGLRHDYTEEDLRMHFEAYGVVEQVYLPTDQVSGRKKGMAYVTFVSPEGAQNAIANSPRSILGVEIGDIVPAISRGAAAAAAGPPPAISPNSVPRGRGGWSGARTGGAGAGGSYASGGGGPMRSSRYDSSGAGSQQHSYRPY